jgi:hypothetical protein
MINVFDNALPEWLHHRVKEQLESQAIEWSFPNYGAWPGDITKSAFVHTPFINNQKEDWTKCTSLMYALDCWLYQNKSIFEIQYLSRCLINFYTAGQNTGWHQDIPDEEDVYSLIYYVNDSDGGTEFKSGEKIKHEENRMILFNSKEWHAPISSTSPRRLSVNYILKGKITK